MIFNKPDFFESGIFLDYYFKILAQFKGIFIDFIFKNLSFMSIINWHQKHIETSSIGDRLSDAVANGMGSWKFIIWQTIIVLIWMALNIVAFVQHWDPYPFILLNLIFSTQAAYAAPIIMMAQNRQSQRDRIQADNDYQTNLEAKREIEALQIHLSKIESEKLDVIIGLLKEIKK